MAEPIPPVPPNDMHETVDAALLLRRIAAGDKEAFHAFYRLYSARVMRMLARNVPERHLAEELVQDVFVAVWLSARGHRSDLGDAELWLFGIIRHKLHDHWRRMSRIGGALGMPLDVRVSSLETPDCDARMSLAQALRTLTPDQRRVIDLVYRSGLTFSEAARALTIPVGTVKSRVNAALRKMKIFLTGSFLT